MDFSSVYKQAGDSGDEMNRRVQLNGRYLEIIYDCLYEEIDKVEDVFDELSVVRFIDP